MKLSNDVEKNEIEVTKMGQNYSFFLTVYLTNDSGWFSYHIPYAWSSVCSRGSQLATEHLSLGLQSSGEVDHLSNSYKERQLIAEEDSNDEGDGKEAQD